MTFAELQTRVLNRVNWSSSEARALVKDYLNERYRAVQTSVNAARTRRGVVSFNTVSGNAAVAVVAAKVLNIYDPTYLQGLLQEISVTDLRAMNAGEQNTGRPTHYAVEEHENDTVQVLFFPKPDGVYALKADVVKTGTEMDEDTDQPTLPVDFHDVLILGAVGDVLTKMEKWDAARVQEVKFEKRLSDLRYFLIKSAHLSQPLRDRPYGRNVWPYSNMV